MSSGKAQRFSSKNVLITGGSSGMGLAAARAFIAEGASVVIASRDDAALEDAARELGPSAFAMRVDLSRPHEIEELFEKFRARYDRLDILYANAGAPKRAPISETTVEMFDAIFAGNFRGAYFTAKYALPLMGDGGAIVFTTSLFDQIGLPDTTVISASKAATRSLTRTLAAEVVGRGIRVNAVAPGSIDTPAMAHMGMTDEEQAESVRINIPKIPMGRVGHAEEIASVVTFLASSDASYITGFEINVDGGRLQL